MKEREERKGRENVGREGRVFAPVGIFPRYVSHVLCDGGGRAVVVVMMIIVLIA